MYVNGLMLGLMSRAGMCLAPVDFGGFGGSGGFAGGSDQGGNPQGAGGEGDSHSHIPIFGQDGGDDAGDGGDDSNPEDDPFAILSSLNQDDMVGDDTQDFESGYEQISPEQVTSLQTEMQEAIKKMGLPATAIPENFDPTDPRQMQQVLTSTVQSAVSQALNVVFRPVQLAITHMEKQMVQRIQNEVKQSRSHSAAEEIIRSEVPEMEDRLLGPILRPLNAQLKQAGKKPHERAKLLRKMIQQMNLKPASNVRRASALTQQEESHSIRRGTAALDSLFGPFQTQQPRR